MKALTHGQPAGAAVASPKWRWPILVATTVLLVVASVPGDRPLVLGMSAGLFAIALVAEEKGRRRTGVRMPARLSHHPTPEARRLSVDPIDLGALDQAADCIQWIDRDGRLLASNSQSLMRSDGAADGLVGKPWSLGWGPAATEAFDAAMTGRAGRFQASRPGADGEPAWWDVLVTPVRDANAGIVRLLAIGRDVTEARAADDERGRVIASERAARSEAERTTRMKDEFVSTLSHELRTPLNAILGWLDVLKQDRSDATLAKALDVIDRNSRRQVQMIDDLLDVSRLISGKVRLDVRRTDLGTVIDEAVASAQPEATAKGVQLVLRLQAPATIEGDACRVLQILRNLVANAIKFTPPGGVVQVTLRHAGTFALVQVTDTGRGLRADVLPYLFERFQQGDTSATRQSSGLGLGLAIVKNLVELHHGTVAAASDGEGLGSTFSV